MRHYLDNAIPNKDRLYYTYVQWHTNMPFKVNAPAYKGGKKMKPMHLSD